MKETAVADFVGRFAADLGSESDSKPRDCRIVMSRRRLVVVYDDDRLEVPLSSVVDVVVGSVPANLQYMFDDTVTVGYETDDGGVRTVLIEGENDTISKFVGVLFKCLLNGTEAVVKHPARVGGRVMDTDVASGELSIADGSVHLTTPDDEFAVDVSTVVGFDRIERALEGTERSTVLVEHVDGEDVVATLLAPESPRVLNLLGRYLRLEYGAVRTGLADVELDEAERRLLVAMYAAGDDVEYARLLDDERSVETVLDGLRKKDLVTDDETDVSLTRRGHVVVIERIGEFDL